MIKSLKYYLVFALVFAGTINMYSQDSIYSIRLKEVEITSPRSLTDKGLVITRIDSLAICQNLHGSMSDLLANSSPVFIKSYGESGLASASFRGTAASHTKVEWNGMEINSPMLGQTDFSLIPVFFADEISLFHGGSSLCNGSGALGGSISIKSKTALNESAEASVIQTYGSFNTSQTFIKLGAGNCNFRTNIRLFKSVSDNDFLFYNTANGLWNFEKQQNANYLKKGALVDFYLKTGKSSLLSLHVWRQIADRSLPAIMSYQGEGRDENQFDTETRASAIWKFFSKKIDSEFLLGLSSTSLSYYLANNTPGGFLLNYNSESRALGFFNKYNGEYKINAKTIVRGTANFNYFNAEFVDKKLETGYVASRKEMGVGISLHHQIKSYLSIFSLMRGETCNGDFLPLMPSVGFELIPLKNYDFLVKSSFTRNYHQPTLNDLYWIPGGNPDLKPERGYSGDLSFSYGFHGKGKFFLKPEITGFYSRIKDWIVWRPGDYRFWQAENIQTVFARGLECKLIAKLDNSNIKYSISAAYNFTKTTNIENVNEQTSSLGTQLVYIPEHSAHSALKISYHKNFLLYSFSYTGQRFTTSSNEETRHSLPGYQIQNILIGRTINFGAIPAEIQFKVNNVLNTNYQAILWRAMPGRNFMLTLKIELNKKLKNNGVLE